MKTKNIIMFFLILMSVFGLAGCSTKESDELISTDDMNLIYEETISPNEYVTEEDDIVYYTVEVYQNDENNIIVNSSSNSEFFEPIQYTVDYDEPITEDNIDTQWTTLMGDPNPTAQDDQLCIVYVSILNSGDIFDERKISFVNRGFEIIENGIDEN